MLNDSSKIFSHIFVVKYSCYFQVYNYQLLHLQDGDTEKGECVVEALSNMYKDSLTITSSITERERARERERMKK